MDEQVETINRLREVITELQAKLVARDQLLGAILPPMQESFQSGDFVSGSMVHEIFTKYAKHIEGIENEIR